MGGDDGKTAIDAAQKLDAALPIEAVRQFAILQPVRRRRTRPTRNSPTRTRSSICRRHPTISF
jgi:hypothetical protein